MRVVVTNDGLVNLQRWLVKSDTSSFFRQCKLRRFSDFIDLAVWWDRYEFCRQWCSLGIGPGLPGFTWPDVMKTGK